jgi:CubicO group peptidase (beta-lactamase class C family)
LGREHRSSDTFTEKGSLRGRQLTRNRFLARGLLNAIPHVFPVTTGTANLNPNRAFSATAYNSGWSGMSGMSGTIGDYARFLQILLNDGELDGAQVHRPEDEAKRDRQHADASGAGLGFHAGLWDSDRSGCSQEPSSGRQPRGAASTGRSFKSIR